MAAGKKSLPNTRLSLLLARRRSARLRKRCRLPLAQIRFPPIRIRRALGRSPLRPLPSGLFPFQTGTG